MHQKQSHKQFCLNAIISDRIIVGVVRFSPAPAPGVLTELAKFEAERVLTHAVQEEIAAGRL